MQRERMLKKEEQVNSSCAPASAPCSQSRQTCSFVLGFIPLIGEPGCPLSGLVHARCSQGHGWYDNLALTDFLPAQGWSLGQLWGDGFECQRQPASDSRTLTHLTGNCALVFLFFPPKPNSCLLYITLGAAYVDSFPPPLTAVLMQLSRHVWWKKVTCRLPRDAALSSHYHGVETRSWPAWLQLTFLLQQLGLNQHTDPPRQVTCSGFSSVLPRRPPWNELYTSLISSLAPPGWCTTRERGREDPRRLCAAVHVDKPALNRRAENALLPSSQLRLIATNQMQMMETGHL